MSILNKKIILFSFTSILLYSICFAQEQASTNTQANTTTTLTNTVLEEGNSPIQANTSTTQTIDTNISTSSQEILVPKQIIKGKAIWYGKAFQGRKMANGKKFDMNDLTIVAHRTLKLGTKIKVTNTKNNISIICTVSDRGPYSKKKVKLKSGKIEKQYTAEIDLSYAAAKILKIDKAGIGDVKIEVY